jgi:hypothetical protein
MFDSYGDGWNGGYVEIIDPASGVVMYTLGTVSYLEHRIQKVSVYHGFLDVLILELQTLTL